MTDAQHLPAPLTSPDCDLRGLPYMPLEVQRLRDSDLALISTGDEFKAAMLLFCASWGQVPAGSVPSDDRILAKLAGTDLSTWAQVKVVALRGWVECSDGRLYHPLVSEKAMEALPGRQAYASRASAAGDRKRREREDRARLFEQCKALGLQPAYNIKTTELRSLVNSAGGEGPTPPRDPSRSVTRDQSHSEIVTSHKTARDPSQPVTSDVTAKRERGKEKESPQPPLGAFGDGFDEAWSIIPDKCRGPAKLDDARASWRTAIESGEIDEARLLAATKAMTRAVAASGDRLPVKAFHRWLKLREWQNWAPSAAAARSVWPGPGHIRDAIIAEVSRARASRKDGDTFAETWLDQVTSWSDVPAAIVCQSGTVARRLQEAVGKLLTAEFGVAVIVRSAGEAA